MVSFIHLYPNPIPWCIEGEKIENVYNCNYVCICIQKSLGGQYTKLLAMVILGGGTCDTFVSYMHISLWFFRLV